MDTINNVLMLCGFAIVFISLISLAVIFSREEKQKQETERRRIELESQKNKKEEEKRRFFNDSISLEEFTAIAESCAKKIKKIKNVSIGSGSVTCSVESQTAKTMWNFTVFFNTNGHLSATYGLTSDVSNSSIPEAFAEAMSLIIAERLQNPSSSSDKTTSQKDESCTGIIVCIAIFAVLGIGGFLIYKIPRLVQIDFSYNSVIDEPYDKIVDKFEDLGFTIVNTCAIYDLDISEESRVGTVDNVVLDENKKFKRGFFYDYETIIDIYYHDIKQISIPFSPKEAKGENYQDIVSQLKEAGFVNIILEPKYDISIGVLHNDSAVISVSVDGSTKYNTDTTYSQDVEIIVRYHALKKNETEGE